MARVAAEAVPVRLPVTLPIKLVAVMMPDVFIF